MLKQLCYFILFSLISSTILASTYNKPAAETNARLGLGYLEKGMYSTSKNRLLTALHEDPEIAAVWYSMAYYLEKTGNKKLAEQYYLKAISVEPHSGKAINNYGTFLCRIGQHQKAITEFLRAAHERTYLHAAGAYENAGTCALMMQHYKDNKKLALTYFQKALENNPNMPRALLDTAKIYHQIGDNVSAEKYFIVFVKIALHNKSAHIVKQYRQYVFSS